MTTRERKPLVVHIDSRTSPLTLEREALRGIDCEIVSVAVQSDGEVIEAIKEADVVLDDHSPVTRAMAGQLTRCRLIIRYGHGYDTVDVDACTERGIMVTNIAGSTSEEVSNHALALLFACARDLKRLDRAVSDGRWGDVYSRSLGRRIWGETAGVVGFGWIGRAMARKCRALGMDVIVHDPYVGDWLAVEYGVRFVGLDELLARSDYVSLHIPHSTRNHHLMGEAAFRKMKRSAYFISTARGPVTDEAALTKALREGWIAGAGIDVFEKEPIAAGNPLAKMDNVVVTPHVAGSSGPGWSTIRRRAGEEAARVLRGERPQVLVNPEVLGKLSGS